jgi:putative ATPase
VSATLFEEEPAKYAPLAERMRPRSLDAYIGQEHLVGQDGPLRKMLESGSLHSMIFWGPPGVGKTTLAYLLTSGLKRPFFILSAISAGVKDVREVIDKARTARGAVLFIDEIHRFSKSQQDALLGAVEKGTVTLIGATTENPSFEVIGALLSRCQVYVLQELKESELLQVLNHALETDAQLQNRSIKLQEHRALLHLSGGDARKLLNLLELVVNATGPGELVITDELVRRLAQERMATYDKGGEQHYDIISAFIKSMRGSDPNGALYWLARMLAGGEQPSFIARRMLILASEDIGNANPNALLIATACFQAVNLLGYPECDLTLAQTVIYLATSPKSNSAYKAIRMAEEVVRKRAAYPVPLHLRNAPTKLMDELGYGEEYQYAHDFEGHFVEQEFLPKEISGTRFYEPAQNPREQEQVKLLRQRWSERYGY